MLLQVQRYILLVRQNAEDVKAGSTVWGSVSAGTLNSQQQHRGVSAISWPGAVAPGLGSGQNYGLVFVTNKQHMEDRDKAKDHPTVKTIF